MMKWLKRCWQRIRELSGDDVYERYLAQHAEHHADGAECHSPLSRAEFFKQWQDQKWQGIKRCC